MPLQGIFVGRHTSSSDSQPRDAARAARMASCGTNVCAPIGKPRNAAGPVGMTPRGAYITHFLYLLSTHLMVKSVQLVFAEFPYRGFFVE